MEITHYQQEPIVNELKALREFIRQPYAWPGGYPIVAVMTDGETLCAKCCRENYRQISTDTRQQNRRSGWCFEGVQLHLEGEPEVCAHCNHETESAYGVPDS